MVLVKGCDTGHVIKLKKLLALQTERKLNSELAVAAGPFWVVKVELTSEINYGRTDEVDG